MFWPVTLLGAVAGWALASIPGALLGALLGQVLDRRLKLTSWAAVRGRFRGAAVELDDEDLLFTLFGRLAKSDGRVLESHIQLAREEMQRLGLDESARRRAMEAFARGKQGRDDMRAPLEPLRQRPERAEVLLRACWRMAWADGRVSAAEQALIRQWARWLGWSQDALRAMADEYRPKQQERPSVAPVGDYHAALRLLGVDGATEPAAIKRAYRRLLSQHHPDKLAGAGATPAQIRAATERTGALHQAYELVRSRRGF
ncbi:co-chaperone DjlA [Pseudomonas sp. LRF_L74]|uniref:co-chaperone DjlA n=1 Tax=Pseudomonas sp. LRF_L74 TaxID=3369422 RepID=UPI003F634D89